MLFVLLQMSTIIFPPGEMGEVDVNRHQLWIGSVAQQQQHPTYIAVTDTLFNLLSFIGLTGTNV
jgi:hypothetical protein